MTRSPDFAPSLWDWVWSPSFGPDAAPLGLLLLGGVAVATIAALWKVRAPGSVTPNERRMLRPELVWLVRLDTLLGRVGPVVLVIGLGYLFFPVGSPETILLSSHSRIRGSSGEWEGEWQKAVAKHAVTAGRDAGPLVTAVCNRLKDQPPATGWVKSDPLVRAWIGATTERLLGEGAGKIVAADRVEHEIVTGLPRWVIESVEITVLNGLTQLHNTNRIVALVAQRQTAAGPTWGAAIETYLAADPTRWRPRHVVLEKLLDAPVVWLETIVRAWREDDDWVARCVFRVDPVQAERLDDSAWGRQQRVALRTIEGAPVASQFVPLLRDVALQPRLVRFPVTGRNVGLELVHDATERVLAWPLAAEGEGAGTNEITATIVTGADASAWEATIAGLSGAPFAGWREFLDEGLQMPLPRFAISSSPPSGGIAIDAREPGELWIMPAHALAAGAEGRPVTRPWSPDETGLPQRAAAADAGIPGCYSWAGVQLVSGEARGMTAFTRRTAVLLTLSRGLESGTLSHPGTAQPAVVSEFAISYAGANGVVRATGTHIGIDWRRQGMLLENALVPAPSFERTRFLVGWTALVRAAYRVARSLESDPVTAGVGLDDYPTPLLDSTALSRFRRRGLMWPLALVVLGVLSYALLMARGILATSKGLEE
jgi:hypothetical protein